MGLRKTTLEITTFESDTAQDVADICSFGAWECPSAESKFAIFDVVVLKDEVLPFKEEEK